MDSSEALKVQLGFLRFFGMYPDEDSPLFYKLWGLLIFLWSGPILVCCQAISIFYVQDTNRMVEELLLLCTTTTIAIKLAIFYLHRKNLPNMLNIFEELDAQIYNDESIRTMDNVFKNCRQMTSFFFFDYIGSVVAILTQLIFLTPSERTWKSTALIPHDFAQLPSVYYGVLFIEGAGNILNCFLAYTIDTYCFLLINLLAGHVEALSLQLAQYGTSIEKTRIQRPGQKLRLLKYMEHYNLLDDFTKELNEHLSLIFFVQVSVGAPVICTCAYKFSQAGTLTGTQMMFLILYSIAMVLQTFLPNYFATNVIENCGLLPKRIFSSNWFNLENAEKKGVLMFMIRTVRPLVIHAGILFEMNSNTFIKIIKSAYSLLALLKST